MYICVHACFNASSLLIISVKKIKYIRACAKEIYDVSIYTGCIIYYVNRKTNYISIPNYCSFPERDAAQAVSCPPVKVSIMDYRALSPNINGQNTIINGVLKINFY